jgi:hypothetical protein
VNLQKTEFSAVGINANIEDEVFLLFSPTARRSVHVPNCE